MILPNKYVRHKESIIGLGALILKQLNKPRTVSYLWEYARGIPEVGTYLRFNLTMDFLFAINLIEFHNGLIRKVSKK